MEDAVIIRIEGPSERRQIARHQHHPAREHSPGPAKESPLRRGQSTQRVDPHRQIDSAPSIPPYTRIPPDPATRIQLIRQIHGQHHHTGFLGQQRRQVDETVRRRLPPSGRTLLSHKRPQPSQRQRRDQKSAAPRSNPLPPYASDAPQKAQPRSTPRPPIAPRKADAPVNKPAPCSPRAATP